MSVHKSMPDQAIFYWYSDGKCNGIIAAHVDDFFCGGSTLFEFHVINKIKEIFKTVISFSYLGLQGKHTSNCIEVDQHNCITEVQPVMFDRKRIQETKEILNADEKQQF